MKGTRWARGQATAEFAVASTVLVLILLGLIDLGRVFYFAVGLDGAAREGARQGSWFDAASGTNPYLYDAAIKSSVDAVLTNSGLPVSVLQNATATCPSPADGNSGYNPPYIDSAYSGSSVNQPLLYICYSNTPGLDLTSVSSGNPYRGQDVNVILLMTFAFANGLTQSTLGPSIKLVANTHMTIGGY